ncbi:phosphatidylserine decarboxylase family protein [Magnetofaba australis]
MAMASPVAPEGLPFIAIFIAVAAAATALTPWPLLWAVVWILAAWCVWFFRDPERACSDEPGLLIAPADGKIVAIREVDAAPITGEKARMVSIFMNVFNVHVNRMPEAGTVVATQYHPGKFLNAALDKAAVENERQVVVMQRADGVRIPFVQVAGLVARRIVCRVGEGAVLGRGERFGLIRFGSRVDVYLPLEAEVRVTLGMKTSAGVTPIAHYPLQATGE